MQPKTADLLLVQVTGSLVEAIQSFLLDRQGRNLAAGTIRFYRSELKLFYVFLEKRGVIEAENVTGDDLRIYQAELAKRRKPRSVHCAYASIRAFFRWYEAEGLAPVGWVSPLKNIRGPRVPKNPLPGISEEAIKVMLGACRGENALRDKAIINLLYSSGLRAGELLALAVKDVNLVTGAVWVGCGKGGKSRTSYCCSITRKCMRSYLRSRGDLDPDDPLFVSRSGERLSYGGLVHVLTSRAVRAGVDPPGCHDFRRAFAISSLRNGGDLVTIMRLMGHSSLEVLKTYLALVTTDLQTGYARFGPSVSK